MFGRGGNGAHDKDSKLRENPADQTEVVAMHDQRTDWHMRAAVSGVLFRYRDHQSRQRAAAELFERGVPIHVALRVLT